mgnify:CR=1 FL=1
MTTATGSFSIDFSVLSDTNPYTNANLTEIGAGRGKILSGVYRWASGASSRTAQVYNGTVSGNLAAKIEFNTAAGSGDAIAAIICDTSGNGYAAVCNSATSLSLIRISALAQADVLGSGNPAASAGDVIELRLNQTSHLLEVYKNGSTLSISATDSTVTAGLKPGFMAIADNTGNATIKSFALDGSTPSGPTITTISDSTPNHLGSLTITGTGFPTSQTGSAGITIGGIAQTVTWNTSTSCSISSLDVGTNKYGTSVNIIVTDASGNASSGYATTFSPRSGGAYVDLSGTLASSGVRLTSTPDLAAGDQIEYYGATGGTIPTDVTVNSDGTYDVSSSVTAFVFRVNNGAGWGTAATETIGTLATISSATPSGTIGTQTTATVGATTDTVSGTFYYVLSATQGHITGVTAAQIKAGNNSSGTAAQKSGSSSVISSTPSVSVTGLTANTTYYYAVVQNTTAGDSNVISSGVFSTAAAPVTSNERNIHQDIIQPIYKPIGRAI